MPLDTPPPATLPHETYQIDWLAWRDWAAPIECPYCELSFTAGRGLVLRLPAQAYEGAYCPGCGSFRYLDLPDDAALHEQYAAASQDFTEDLASYAIPIGNSLEATLDCLARMRPASGAFRSVLDVGCGFGLSLLACRDGLGIAAVGLEPSPSASVGQRRLGVPIECRYLADYRHDHPQPFDLVTAVGVVEHVRDPVGFVRQLWAASATAVAFLVPPAEGLCAETPAARLFSCLSPGSHLTMMSEAGARALARRLGVAEVAIHRLGELMVVWYSRVPLVEATPEQLLDAAVDTALACLQSPDPLLWQGGLNRLLTMTYAPRYRAWHGRLLALADSFLDRQVPGLRQDQACDLTAAPSTAYSLLFMGAVQALSEADCNGALQRLRAAQRHIAHLKATRPTQAIHALNLEASIAGTIAHLEGLASA